MNETHTHSSYSHETRQSSAVSRQNVSDSQKLAQVPNYNICGEFYLQKTKFFIILSKNEPKIVQNPM